MGYSEADTKAKLITPKLISDGWSENLIVREYYFTVKYLDEVSQKIENGQS